MKNNLKDCGLFHGCKIYIETEDEVVYQLFLKNFSEAMQKHYGVLKKEDAELQAKVTEILTQLGYTK